MLSLTAGCPDSYLRSLTGEIMLKATQHRIPKDLVNDAVALGYGENQGDPEFLEELAKFLSDEYGSVVKSDNLMATAGATHGLHLLLSLLFRPGEVLFVEEPTYFFVRQTLPELGFKTVPVPCDDNGIIIEELEKLIVKHCPSDFVKSEKKLYKTMIYVIPVFNNPGGFSYSAARCEKLVQLAKEHDALLVADDVYNLLYFNKSPQAPKRLTEFDSSSGDEYIVGNVLSNCSFSKILAPSVRCGWIEAPTEIINFFITQGLCFSGGNTCQYVSTIITSAFQLGLVKQQVNVARQQYERKMLKTCEILHDLLPDSVTFVKPTGGFFVWLKLPTGKSADDLLKLATEEYGITFHVGSKFSSNGLCQNMLRISVAQLLYDEQVTATTKLCHCIKKYLQLE